MERSRVRVEVAGDYSELCEVVTERTLDILAPESKPVSFMPTGSTFDGIYPLMAPKIAAMDKIFTFLNWDEYCIRRWNGRLARMSADNQKSFQYFMQEKILHEAPNIQSRFPGENNIKHPGSFDAEIRALGAIHLALYGVGEDGHIAFNMPGTPFDSVTRLVRLNQATRNVNKKLHGERVSRFALTTGIATGMMAEKMIVVASGQRKAPAVRQLVYGDISTDFPATSTRNHKDLLILVDQAAAANIV